MSSEGQHTPSPSSSSQATPTRQSAPKAPQTLSEWQLLAVLHRANLLQYYETFISQGGDDVNQIMQCDESEFLEIMSLVGMLSKPLHVRRLQRTLTQFSKDPASFNLQAIPQIGPPPTSPYPVGLGATDPMQLFIPAIPSTTSAAGTTTVTTEVLTTSPGLLISSSSSPAPLRPAPSTLSSILSLGATANVLQGDYLQYLIDNSTNSASPSPHHDDFVSLGDFDPNCDTGETPVLSEAQIGRLAACCQAIVARLPPYKPKLVQNKKKISPELLELIAMSPTNPRRPDEYRKYSAIYGRFDAKRRSDKILTLHEVSVNEAAAQICMLVPALLTRRDELFPLARQVVKDAGYHYTKSTATGFPKEGGGPPRKRGKSEDNERGDDCVSPRSSSSASPALNVVDDEDAPTPKKLQKDPLSPTVSTVDRWATERLERATGSQRRDENGPSTSRTLH